MADSAPIAESFGSDAERYERARPRYPAAMVAAIVAALPGRAVLDVGSGTGIAARQFAAAGCEVLGVEPDGRMAPLARAGGVPVEEARFEQWDPDGRRFDGVVAAQSWHWIDAAAGTAAAASVLNAGGRFAAFWNAAQPPAALAEAFADVHRRVLPGEPRNPFAQPAEQAYGRLLDQAAAALTGHAAFAPVERWRFSTERVYTREQWLDQLPTFGLYTQLAAEPLAALLTETGAVVDAAGGDFTMTYTALVVTAARVPR